MKKIFIALSILSLSFFGICSAGSKKKHKKTTIKSQPQVTAGITTSSENINQEKYNKLREQLTEHLKTLNEDQINNEYISQYLKKIGSPEALKLLDNTIKLQQYHNKDLMQLFETEQYAQAINTLNSAIAIDSNNALFWGERGTAYFGLNKLHQAIDDFTKAINISPQFGFFYLERALAYMKQGNKKAMKDDMKTAAQLGDPDAQEMLNLLAKSAIDTSSCDSQAIAKRLAMKFIISMKS